MCGPSHLSVGEFEPTVNRKHAQGNLIINSMHCETHKQAPIFVAKLVYKMHFYLHSAFVNVSIFSDISVVCCRLQPIQEMSLFKC